MVEPTAFHSFSLLPAELRLKIWRLSFPERIVELALDEASPLLMKPQQDASIRHPRPRVEYADMPIKDATPSLFSVCHESRAICLAEYVSCGSTYLHPRLDTLYINARAYGALGNQLRKLGRWKRSDKYPIGMLDKIAIELQLPLSAPRYWAFVALSRVMHIFGSPKSLLLIQSERISQFDYRKWTIGAGTIELRKCTWGVGGRWLHMDTEELIEQIISKLEERAVDNQWLDGPLPKISSAVVERTMPCVVE
jgi:hypothetical protein